MPSPFSYFQSAAFPRALALALVLSLSLLARSPSSPRALSSLSSRRALALSISALCLRPSHARLPPTSDTPTKPAACEEQVGERSKDITSGEGGSHSGGGGGRAWTAEESAAVAVEGGEAGEGLEGGNSGVSGVLIEKRGKAKALCIPLTSTHLQPALATSARCFACAQPATCSILWGRSY